MTRRGHTRDRVAREDAERARVRDLHARAQEVARAIAYVRAGGPLGHVRPRPYLGEFEAREALHEAFASYGTVSGLPVRRVGRLPEHDSRPVLLTNVT